MPLPHEQMDMHRAKTNGYLTLGEQVAIRNENRRVVGKKFIPKYDKVPFNDAALTTNDFDLLGQATIAQISKKVDITYSKKIEELAENNLLAKYNNVIYNIQKTEKFRNRMFLYLVTLDEKGGNRNG